MDSDIENLTIVKNLTKSKVITNDINAICDYNQNFCFISTSHGDLYLIWATIDNYLEVYDLNKEIKVDRIKGHEDWINSCHNFYDKGKDLVITCSDDKTIKIWEFKPSTSQKVEYLNTITTIKQDTIGNFRNAFMLTDTSDNLNYVLAELTDYAIVLYDEKGKIHKRFKDCVFHDIWVDEETNLTHLVTSYAGRIKFHEMKTGKISREFNSGGTLINAALVNNLLIVADDNGIIRTFDVRKCELINQLNSGGCPITEITVWDLEYFFAGDAEGKFTCYETKSLTKVSNIKNPGCEKVVYASSFIHPLYGAALAISGPISMEKGILSILFLSDAGKKEIETGGPN